MGLSTLILFYLCTSFTEIKSHDVIPKIHINPESLSRCFNFESLLTDLSGYGKSWMYFPDGNGTAQNASLVLPVDIELLYLPTEDFVSFLLYTRRNYNTSTILKANDTEALAKSHFDSTKKTKFLIHGWNTDPRAEFCQVTKNNFLKAGDYNVFCVDWSKISNELNYVLSVYETKHIGAVVAKFVDFLVEQNYSITNINFVGHSLGAHISGIAGFKVKKGRIPRISGLDPALPLYIYHGAEKNTLDATDADFVDIIHSCGGVLGVYKSIGAVDFYPNGGLPCQPGCNGLQEVVEACSHTRAWRYFAKSILYPSAYIGTKCKSWDRFLAGKCKNKQKDRMGEYTNVTIRGNFYLNAIVHN